MLSGRRSAPELGRSSMVTRPKLPLSGRPQGTPEHPAPQAETPVGPADTARFGSYKACSSADLKRRTRAAAGTRNRSEKNCRDRHPGARYDAGRLTEFEVLG